MGIPHHFSSLRVSSVRPGSRGSVQGLVDSASDLHRRWKSQASLPPVEQLKRARWVLGERAKARIYLRHADLGLGVRVAGKPIVGNYGTLIIGNDCTLRSISAPIDIYVGPGATMALGQGVRLHSGDTLSALLRIEIGDRVQIGPHVAIYDNPFHDLYQRNKVPASEPVVIEDDVWLASRCTVLPGVRIGRGAVVGAHALVNRDVEPFTVVGGVPARPLMRLDPEKFVISDWSSRASNGSATMSRR
jgi:maltose O-acetyltransferase